MTVGDTFVLSIFVNMVKKVLYIYMKTKSRYLSDLMGQLGFKLVFISLICFAGCGHPAKPLTGVDTDTKKCISSVPASSEDVPKTYYKAHNGDDVVYKKSEFQVVRLVVISVVSLLILAISAACFIDYYNNAQELPQLGT